MRRAALWGALLLAGATGCDDGAEDSRPAPDAARADAAPAADATTADATPPAPDAAPDAAPLADASGPVDAAPAADAGPADAAPPPFPPRPRPVDTAGLVAPRDWRFARGLIHMHSVHSHDACDGDPKPGGEINAPCLARLRAAMCHDRMDYLLLTDHPDSFGDIPFEESFLHAEGDTWVPGPAGEPPHANLIACPDGGQVLLAPGSEGDLTPVMFQRKPERALLRDASPEGVAGLREAGAFVLQAHIERFTADELAPLGLDGIEIYNLHANLDPRGELRQLAEVLPDVSDWIGAGVRGPHPDLAFLAVYRPNHLALEAWDGLTPRGRMMGFAGSDIHENLPPLLRPLDGDRIDSYRRLGAWFSNYLLVPDVTYDAVRDAVGAHRLFVTFDILGPPDGFDWHAETAAGDVVEMGGEVALAAGVTLRATPPTTGPGSPRALVLRRVDADGPVEIARVEDGPLTFAVDQPGVYRLEVWITPEHLRADLRDFADRFIRPLVWIYTNPIYVR